MSAGAVRLARTVELPPEPGLSPRAIRSVLHVYARLCQPDGSFKYGIRGSKLAELADYSLATVRRAQRYLVDHGFVEKVKVGGGRVSTRWRLVLERLGFASPTRDESAAGHTSDTTVTKQPSPPDTAQGIVRSPERLPSPGVRSTGMSSAPDEICFEHGSAGGTLRDGLTPRCPFCRRNGTRQLSGKVSQWLLKDSPGT